jgi:subtilisin family serine protease
LRHLRRTGAVARGIVAAAAALAVAPASASAQDLSRADPSLRFLLMNRDVVEAADPAAPALRPELADPAVPRLFEAALDRSTGVVRVRALVLLGPGGESALLSAGATIGTRAGDVVTARIPIDAVEGLLSLPSIRSMEAATALSPLSWTPRAVAAPATAASAVALSASDSAMADAGFEQVRTRVGDRWEGLAGSGVIVGVYDSGLDLEHDDFRRGDGTSRVVFAWDQTIAGSGPGVVGGHTLDYGTECAGTVINRGDCAMIDRIGHGTHVTGTAAGDGSATGRGQPAYRFPGGAPDASLIVVKGGDVEFHADQLVDGVAYIFARAEALGRPAVVNISLSSQSGPHDGTTLLEQALDALSGPGRILVSGSGNAGDFRNTHPTPVINGPYHAEGRAGGRNTGLRISSYTPFPGEVNDGAVLELWYGGRDSVAVTVTAPGGQSATAVTGDSASLMTDGGAVVVLNALDGPAPGNGDHAALIAIVDADAAYPPEPGLWRIDVAPVAIHEGGDYHLWLTATTFGPEPARLEGQTSNRYLVGVPASADRILAAGAHVTRLEWLGVDEEPRALDPPREALGDIAHFSSPGPRRDGVLKPDLTAPGKVVISSLSSRAVLWDPFPELVEADSVHVGLLGTSMAAPQVAAAVAILLQLEPTLTPEEARETLRLTATADSYVPGTLPDPAWGAGKLNVAAAVQRLRPDGLAGEGEAVSLSENPIRSDALVITYAAPPRSLAVYTVIGERVRSFAENEMGPLTTVWALDTDAGGEVANGVYVLVAEVAGRSVVRKILVARR